MENQGYEEETSSRAELRIPKSHLDESSSLDDSVKSAIPEETRSNDRLRLQPEAHVYEDIIVPRLDEVENLKNSSLRFTNYTDKNICGHAAIKWPNDRENHCIVNDDGMTSNFHRNLTLPLRRTILGDYENTDNLTRYSVRVTNRERSQCFENVEPGIVVVVVDDDDNDNENYDDIDETTVVANNRDREIMRHDEIDKPASRRRRKKDCKHCKKSVDNGIRDNNRTRTIGSENLLMPSGDAVSSIGNIVERIGEVEKCPRIINREPIFAIPNGKLPFFDPHSVTSGLTGKLSPPSFVDEPSIFSISNNANRQSPSSPKALNYDKNHTADIRLVSVDLSIDERRTNPAKYRTGMKVNSIYSQQEHCNTKDTPIFLTNVKEQHFQRAYSLPTRTQTPSSQNRLNLRRSVRGEPPPHPARLRKNCHGWTLHFARPLDGTGCARSIVLVLIAILALLGIGGIALYIVFEPDKLEIIQQYLRSSATNTTTDLNSTLDATSSRALEVNVETTTFKIGSLPLAESSPMGGLSRETTFLPETEAESMTTKTTTTTKTLTTTTTLTTTMTMTTTSETGNDPNVTRHCDDCYDTEVCVALVDEQVPICRNGPDPLDPTGCNGLCLINKQKCHRLDFDAFRCVEVEHYCLDDEWTCSNTLCIPLVKHCDGHMNCYDHSDEYDCVCDVRTHFQCGNETSCLPLERRCDGKIDCWDASDEINCTLACPTSGEFTCSNGECILKARFCDGFRDCTDGSDEPHGCQGRCNKHEFSCLNSRCITKAMRCNGIDDCGDNSDERNCRDRIFRKPVA